MEMEELKLRETELLVNQMLKILDSSSEEENDGFDDETNYPQQKESGEEEEYYESANEEEYVEENDSCVNLSDQKNVDLKNEGLKGKTLYSSTPVWVAKDEGDCTTSSESVKPPGQTTPLWRRTLAGSTYKCPSFENSNDLDASLKEFDDPNGVNQYADEVNRAVYGDTAGHPNSGSAGYFQAAQNYAVFGQDFLDFPQELEPLLEEQQAHAEESPEEVPVCADYSDGNPINSECGSSFLPAPPVRTTFQPRLMPAGGFIHYPRQLSPIPMPTAGAFSHFQLYNSVQTSLRGAPYTSGAMHGMIMGNRVSYIANRHAPPTVICDQQTTTTNIISHSSANSTSVSTLNVHHTNPMLNTTTQQYLNTYSKETQILTAATTQGSTADTNNIRLVYEQMFQKQIQLAKQHHAAVVAAMIQQQAFSVARRANNISSPRPFVPATGGGYGLVSSPRVNRSAPSSSTSNPSTDLNCGCSNVVNNAPKPAQESRAPTKAVGKMKKNCANVVSNPFKD